MKRTQEEVIALVEAEIKYGFWDTYLSDDEDENAVSYYREHGIAPWYLDNQYEDFTQNLIDGGVLTEEEIDACHDEIWGALEGATETACDAYADKYEAKIEEEREKKDEEENAFSEWIETDESTEFVDKLARSGYDFYAIVEEVVDVFKVQTDAQFIDSESEFVIERVNQIWGVLVDENGDYSHDEIVIP